MSPFDNPYALTSELENKISTQLSGQMPMFITDEHPLFVKFLKYYYEFLEAGELTLTATIDNIAQETPASNLVLDENGEKIVTERGAGTLTKFVVGETITGGTSNATAKVLAEDLANGKVFITAKTQFINGETVTGGTSSSTGTVTKYRANPIQNIQQLLSYADVDNTIYDFLDQLRDSFMNSIPKRLADGIDTRNLIKNIRELYRTKGTSEGHKIFMKLLLGETSEVFYPNTRMMRVSDGKWNNISKIRCSPGSGVEASEVIGRTLTGQTSGATVVISNAATFSETADPIVEFEIDSGSLVGTFVDGEVCKAVSKETGYDYNFTIRQIINDFTLTNDGILYSVGDLLDVDSNTSIGNGLAAASVKTIKSGGVSDIVVDDAGTGYRAGEPLLFTTSESDVDTAAGVVSILEGSLLLDGTAEVLDNGVTQTSTDAGDFIVLEEGTVFHEDEWSFILEDGTLNAPYAVYGTDTSYSNTKGYYYPLYLDFEEAENSTITKAKATTNGKITDSKTLVLDGNSGTIAVDMVVFGEGLDPSATIKVATVVDQNNITLDTTITLADDVVLSFRSIKTAVHTHKFLEFPNETFYMPSGSTNHHKDSYDSSTYDLYVKYLRLDSTAIGGYTEDTGSRISAESGTPRPISRDTYGTSADRIGLEEGSTTTESSRGSIARAVITDSGAGYTALPDVSISTDNGTSANLLAITTDIGGVDSVETTNIGFKYFEAPQSDFRANFVLKDVTGTFNTGNTLSTHTGTVRGYDSSTQVLQVSIEDNVRVALNIPSSLAVGLEDSLAVHSQNEGSQNLLQLENILDEGDQIVLEQTSFDSLARSLTELEGQLPQDRLVTDALGTSDEYIVLESGNGQTAGSAIILESEDATYFPPVSLEVATDTTDSGGHIVNEGSGDNILTETAVSKGDATGGQQNQRILTESSIRGWSSTRLPGLLQGTAFRCAGSIDSDDLLVELRELGSVFNIGEPLKFNGAIIEVGGAILLDGTDANGTDGGSQIQHENFDDSNSIILNGTDSDLSDANDELILDAGALPSAGSIAIDGTNSSSFHAGDNIINEATGIDYSAGTTVITDSGGASGTIVNADIAKGNFSVGVTAETYGTYGTDIASRISEDLIRIQDSYYYQDFSYEVQTASGTNSYINELRKSVHPAGFLPFGKVSIASSISAAIGTVGSSLGGGYTSDTDTYSPILASTLEVLFSETMQRRLKSIDINIGAFEDAVILESAEEQTNIDDTIVLNGTDSSSNNAGDSLLAETQLFVFPDFEGIELEHETDTSAGGNGIIALNGTDSSSSNANSKIISESAEALSNNLVLDSYEDSKHFIRTDAGSDILLDGTDSSSTDSGSAIELEDPLHQGNIKIGLEPISQIKQATILNEAGGSQQLETSSIGAGPDHEVGLVSFISRRIQIADALPRNLSTGAVTIARAGFSERGVIELEGTQDRGKLLINLAETESVTYVTYTHSAGEGFSLEDGTDLDRDNSFSFADIDTYRNDEFVLDGHNDLLILNGTDGSSSNAGDNLILNATDGSASNDGSNIIFDSEFTTGHNILTEDATDANSSAGADVLVTEDIFDGALFLNDITRSDLILMDDAVTDATGGKRNTDIDGTAILLEGSGATVACRQEDGTQVATTFGDRILLEAGIGWNDQLLLDQPDRIEAEENINKGTIPFKNYTISKTEPLTRSAEIKGRDIGQISLEDEADEATNIRLEGHGDATGIIIMNGIDIVSTEEGNPIAMEKTHDIPIHHGTGSVILNGIDGSSTDAGEQITFESGTFDEFERNFPTLTPVRWDSSSKQFSNITITFDNID